MGPTRVGVPSAIPHLLSQAETTQRLIPDARLHRMENAWHMLWFSDGADEMIRLQQEFVVAHAPTG